MTDWKRLRELAVAAKGTMRDHLARKQYDAECGPTAVIALLDDLQHERDHSKMLSEANSALYVEKRAVENYCAKVRGEYTTARQHAEGLQQQLDDQTRLSAFLTVELAEMKRARDEACDRLEVAWSRLYLRSEIEEVGDGGVAALRAVGSDKERT